MLFGRKYMPMLLNVIKEYDFYSPVDTVLKLDGGNINTTYKLTCADGESYILQKINKSVFVNPEKIMDNIIKVTDKVGRGIIEKSLDKLQVIKIKFTRNGKSLCCIDGEYYRVYEFMPRAVTYTCGIGERAVYKAGEAYGQFALLLNEGEGLLLNETIKDFHNTPLRLNSLDASYQKAPKSRKNKAKALCETLLDFKEDTEQEYKKLCLQPIRIVHNDTKISNVAFDRLTGDAIGILDLDTVMNGWLAYDFGDAVRSVAGPEREDEWDTDSIWFDIELYTAFARGYVGQVVKIVGKDELKSLAVGIRLVTLELAARFLTDYLDGDVYFKTEYSEQNLYRARCQSALLADIDKKFNEIKEVLDSLYDKYERESKNDTADA